MCSDLEKFVNIIGCIDNIQKIIFGEIKIEKEKKEEILTILYDWNKYKNVQEIIDLKNEYINNAIREVLKNEKFIKILKEDTNINIDIILTEMS